MEDTEFNTLATQILGAIEAAVEAAINDDDVDMDFEMQPGGVLELSFADRSKIIINRHGVAKEIWVAARAGGFHFRWQDGTWQDTRDNEELLAKLSRLCSEQAGEAVRLG